MAQALVTLFYIDCIQASFRADNVFKDSLRKNVLLIDVAVGWDRNLKHHASSDASDQSGTEH